MSRGTNQKFKFTYLMQIMLAKTDDEHALTMPQIMDELEKYDVTAERKSIYADFQDMTDKFGIEIIKEQIGRETYYHVGSREFELAEVKLLIDAIQSSKFITQTKSRELINKIKSNVSEHQAKQLQRQVYINDRVKAMNESVYYNVDDIHTAIYQNKKIRTAGSSCTRVGRSQYESSCTPYKQNTNGSKVCKVGSTSNASEGSVGNINNYSYLRHEFEQAKKSNKKIIIVYNSLRSESGWFPSYMKGYEDRAVPFWKRDINGNKVGNYAFIKEELGVE